MLFFTGVEHINSSLFLFRFQQLVDIHFSLEKLNILLSLAVLRLSATLRSPGLGGDTPS